MPIKHLHVLKNLILVLLISVALLELALRLMGFSYYWAVARTPDSRLGWKPLANAIAEQTLEGYALVRTNSLGFRGDEPAPFSSKQLRIAILGDSFTEAVQLPIDKTWWQQTQALLQENCPLQEHSLQMQSFAVSGYSSAQQYRVLTDYVRNYQPDVVIQMFFAGNDMLENHPVLAHDKQRPFYKAKKNRWQEDYLDDGWFELSNSSWFGPVWRTLLRLRTTQAITYIKHTAFVSGQKSIQHRFFEPGVDAAIYNPPATTKWQQAWNNTEALITQTARFTKALGADYILSLAPTGYQVAADAEFRKRYAAHLGSQDLFYPERRLSQLADGENFPIFPLAPALAKIATDRRTFLHGFAKNQMGIGHWNSAGQRAAAELLAPALCSRLQQRIGLIEQNDD